MPPAKLDALNVLRSPETLGCCKCSGVVKTFVDAFCGIEGERALGDTTGPFEADALNMNSDATTLLDGTPGDLDEVSADWTVETLDACTEIALIVDET